MIAEFSNTILPTARPSRRHAAADSLDNNRPGIAAHEYLGGEIDGGCNETWSNNEEQHLYDEATRGPWILMQHQAANVSKRFEQSAGSESCGIGPCFAARSEINLSDEKR
ncbi:hypothetical protein FANTH_3863 [Fusarium anthophilum]|uniref:Uncharacterized protein n=1 Tax=Fusarium anthophilum TaxID=48485 RepID=A0A8H5E8G8_9HYPO|nr:hypothetical protein FANTH_3863 [Fusarium anthophilum]